MKREIVTSAGGASESIRMSARARISAAVGAVAFLVLASTGVAFGIWTTTSATSGSVTAASVTMTISATAPNSLITTYQFAGVATNSPILVRSLLLTDSGATPLTYAISATGTTGNTLASSVTVKLWVPTGVCTTTAGSNATTGTLAALPGLPPGATSVAAGAAVTLCVSTQLATTVASATLAAPTTQPTITPTFVVTGTVGTSSWTTTASDTPFTQRVYQVSPPTGALCTQNSIIGIPTTATIRWTAPASPPSAVSYSFVDATTLATVTPQSVSGTSATFGYGNLNGATETVLVRASEATYGSASIGLPFTLSQSPVLLGVAANAKCVTPAAS